MKGCPVFHAFRRTRALIGVSSAALLVSLASPAVAQDTGQDKAPGANPNQPQTPGTAAIQDQRTSGTATSPSGDEAQGGDVVVTGTLFRRTDTETPSPVTVLTSESLQRSGITNVADAVRSISADNSGSIPTAFSAGFGSGSAGVSLRGLTVNSTLVLIDGIRTTYYPFADDGQRAFVDLNSIQKSSIDRIEVLKDGASSTYGADAIGGVVNIITRKQINGVEGTVEGGISERGDGGEQRAILSAGYGDLSAQHFNFYVTGEYEHDGFIGTKDRGFPYNTNDLTSIGGDDNNIGAFGGFGTRFGTTSAVVRPATYTPGNIFSGVTVAGQPTLILNPSGCATGQITRKDATGAFCEQNQALYDTIQPEQTRYGATARLTANIGTAQAYLTGTYYHSDVFSTFAPQSVRQQNPINTRNIVLPALLANGQINPQDPYAGEGLGAQLSYSFGDLPQNQLTKNNLYRAAGGVAGKFGDGWSYSVDASYASSVLTNTSTGYLNIAGLTSAINNGTYNFLNPSLNTPAVLAQVSPTVVARARSELGMAQAVVTKALFQLPGGPLQLGIGGSVRREVLNNPNANVGNAFLGLNAVTASGRRTVEAGFFEINAPVLKQLELDASGRYDHYSDGFSRFSPKVGAKFTPFRQLALRGTYSQGFRAPSFAESFNGAVIGYTTATPPASVIAAHNNDAYVKSYAFGYNTASNPALKPELSRSFTGGAVVQPLGWLSLTADYYNIRKTQVITGGPLAGQAISAYYAGTTLPAGYSVTLDDPDPLAPNAIRKVLIVNSPYENAASLLTSGIDLSVIAHLRPVAGVKFTSALEGTEILKYNFRPCTDNTDPNCATQHYVGTQAPYILSSGAGTPRWRANWQNTAEVGPLSLSGTVYYVSGYKTVAEDQNGAGALTCDTQLYDPSLGNSFCHTKGYVDVDLVGQIRVNEKFTFYVNVLNLFDASAPLNPANYAAVNYNPTWTQSGIVGRFFRAGANFKF